MHESAGSMSGMLERKGNGEEYIHVLEERMEFPLEGDMPLSHLLRVYPVGQVTQKAKEAPLR